MSETRWRVADGAADGPRLAEAVLAAVQGDADEMAWIRAGAVATVGDASQDEAAAARFRTLLELAYLVASADGFAATERVSLAALLERMTQAAVDHDTLELHFRDLDDAVAQLGRHERLARAAADLGDAAQARDVIGLVATVALADGHISTPEFEAMVELGRHVAVGRAEVLALTEAAVARVEAHLR